MRAMVLNLAKHNIVYMNEAAEWNGNKWSMKQSK